MTSRKLPRVRDYSWAEEIEAVCVTAIDRGRRDAVVAALALDVGSEYPATFAAAEHEQSEDRVVVQVYAVGDHLVVVEPNGFAGSLPETLLPMVDGRDAVSVFWNVNANMRVLLVDLGEVVREFDPLLYDDGGRPMPEERRAQRRGTSDRPRADRRDRPARRATDLLRRARVAPSPDRTIKRRGSGALRL